MKPRSFLFISAFALMGCLAVLNLNAQSDSPPPPPPVPPVPVNHRLPINSPDVQSAPVAVPAGDPNQPTVDKMLKWDSESKEVTVPAGTAEGHFTFHLTNVSPQEVVILSVSTSCGCTVARLPEQPWRLVPGTNGEINVTMNLAGKSGAVTKTVTVATDHGMQQLLVKSTIVPPTTADQMNPGNREENQKLALADRQAVFKGDCVRCHVEPAKDKSGLALYAAACGVCHEAEHRASMVPNLHALTHETNAEYWRTWITHGKTGTLMPAFSQVEGGILTDGQIESLVSYLAAAIPSKVAVLPQTRPAGVH